MENENRDVFNITWQGIDIQITCSRPDYLSSYRKIYGYEMLHIEVRSLFPENAPLPITETGYKSIFIPEPELAEYGGSLKYVTSYLHEKAKSKDWLETQAQANQYQLF